jgi:hypothetical protein
LLYPLPPGGIDLVFFQNDRKQPGDFSAVDAVGRQGVAGCSADNVKAERRSVSAPRALMQIKMLLWRTAPESRIDGRSKGAYSVSKSAEGDLKAAFAIFGSPQG